MEWINTKKQKPKFGETVLVHCNIYGKFLATYEQIDNTGWGNWRYQNELGILPPAYWMRIPEIPTSQS